MEGQVGAKDDIINLISSRADEGDGGYAEGTMSIPVKSAAYILLRKIEPLVVPKRKSFT